MKKGIVMEVKPNTIIMMTPEGEFVKTKNSLLFNMKLARN
ncbi:anti-sigma factor domain-containing protein [Bacillus sp. P14.5]|nr:anti-sigma factor domain-containing protein [Bacillus sp. P14.5]